MGLVIFDLDGTLCPQRPSSTSPFERRLCDGIEARCRELAEAGHRLAIASNQGGIARGFSVDVVTEHFDWVSGMLGIAAYRFAWEPERKKPGPVMLRELMEHFGVSVDESWMIGDSADDERAAIAAGVRFVHVAEFVERGIC